MKFSTEEIAACYNPVRMTKEGRKERREEGRTRKEGRERKERERDKILNQKNE